VTALRALRRLPRELVVRRAWPHRDGLAVEARARGAGLVGAVITDDDVRVFAGQDPALPALAPALAAGGALLGHRPARRAVLRVPDGRYLKVVRPGRAAPVVDGLAETAARLAGLAGAPLVPVVRAADPDAGWVRLDPLAGPTLHALLTVDPAAAVATCRRVGDVLATLRTAPADGLPRHGHADEVTVLRRWLADADGWSGSDLLGGSGPVVDALYALPAPRWVPCHRDLHDKQIVAMAGALGLLDLDTLCAADPALDPANLLAHLHLRRAQGVCAPPTAVRCAQAVLDPARTAGVPDAALRAYTAAALLRLAAVYTFRPGPPGLPARLAAAATDPLPRHRRTP
jgi:hypothetical protein